MLSARGQVSEAELQRYRRLECELLLPLVADYCKADPDFTPIKNSHTHRWNLEVAGRHFELLTTGPKWFDTRAHHGGGGAVDLTMHLCGLDFKQAVHKLRGVFS